MSKGSKILSDISIDDPKLNLQSRGSSNFKQISSANINTKTTKKANLMNPPYDQPKAFRISPAKSHLDSMSPIKSPLNILPLADLIDTSASNCDESISSFFEHNDSAEEAGFSQDHGRCEHYQTTQEIEDLTIMNRDLILEIEALQDQLESKNHLLDLKVLKINELMHCNNRLISEIKVEREINEKDFNSWLDVKTNLELQIFNLKQSQLNETLGTPTMTNDSVIEETFVQIHELQAEISKLKKKVSVLTKENELEVQSKLMIMDELEMMRERYLEINNKHEILKLDYDDLVRDLIILRDEHSGTSDYNDDRRNKIDELNLTDEEDPATPTIDSISCNETPYSDIIDTHAKDNSININNQIPLRIKKTRISSRTSTISSANSRIASLRNNSLNKAIRNVELKSQKEKYEKEMMKYEFEIRSLKLQYEKLLSFIGFSSQLNANSTKDMNSVHKKISDPNFSTLFNNRITSNSSNNSSKTIDNLDYSDAVNIEKARKNLKTVMKSASAMPIRPGTAGSFKFGTFGNFTKDLNEPIDIYQDFEEDTRDGEYQDDLDNMDNASFNQSVCYSTDYEQGETKRLDFGCTSSFEESGDGDDELDDYESDMIQMSDLLQPQFTVKTAPKRSLPRNRKYFSSNNSLNVSYKMDFMISRCANRSVIDESKNTGDNEAIASETSKFTPRRHLKKFTPSVMNLKSNNVIAERKTDSDTNQDYLEIDNNGNLNLGEDGFLYDDLHLINGNERMLNQNKRTKMQLSMSQISEVDESEFNEDNDGYTSTDEDENDDDDDDDDTFDISAQELKKFEIGFIRNGLHCPKHSSFHCFCHTNKLIDPLYYKIFSSPIYSLRRIIEKYYNVEEHRNKKGRFKSGHSLKMRAKLLSNSILDLNDTKLTGHKGNPMRYHHHHLQRGLYHQRGETRGQREAVSATAVSNNRHVEEGADSPKANYSALAEKMTGSGSSSSAKELGDEPYENEEDILVVD